MQKRNVVHFVQEFECELRDTSGKCMNVGAGSGEITRNILLPALNQDAVMIVVHKDTDASESIVEYANRTYCIDGVLEFEALRWMFRRATCPRSTSPSPTTCSRFPFCSTFATTSDSEKPHIKLKELLRSIGFRIRHCCNREMSFVDKKPNAFMPAIMSTFTFLHEMPPERAEDFKKEFTREYTKGKYTRNHELAVNL